MTDDEYFVANTALDANEWRGLLDLANALGEFEPLGKRGNLGVTVADRLVGLGLAVTGPCNSRYNKNDYPVGYKLSDFGWKIKERGRFPKASG